MSAIASISGSSFVSRPQAPPTTTRAAPSPKTDEASPTREPDRVDLSPAVVASSPAGAVEPVRPVEGADAPGAQNEPAPAGAQEELSQEEQDQVRELKARDAEVKAHEQAHVAAAGPYYRGGPTYSYQKGPDGNRYAVGGSVQIDTSPVPGDPEATIAKAQTVRRAALAPAQPSSTDQQVAAAASRMEAEARREQAEASASPETSEDAEPAAIGDAPVTDDSATRTENDDSTDRVTGAERSDANAPDATVDDAATQRDPSLTRTSAGVFQTERGETPGSALDVFA